MIINNIKDIKNSVLHINRVNFDVLAMDIFQYQATCNEVYRKYIHLINKNINDITKVEDIPFLPISLFKSHEVKTGLWDPEISFLSSGTTGKETSTHLVHSTSFYLQNTVNCFNHFYKDVRDYLIIALLPAYLEREGSSLVMMMQHFISLSLPQSGFYLDEYEAISDLIKKARAEATPVLLMGVSFALLDFAEKYEVDMSDVIVMETGGMKGRRKEIIRQDLHEILKRRFNLPAIHSEYGMTELLSQAYSQGGGIFRPSPTLRVLTRPVNDPLGVESTGKTGVLNIIDLANIDSCSFIATDDLGIVYPDGSFTVSGRLDNSDIRGCNLLLN